MRMPLLGSLPGFASVLLFGAASLSAAPDPPAPGGVEKQALQAGVYRTPAASPVSAPRLQSAVTVMPAYQVIEPSNWLSDRLYYHLKAELAWNAAQPRSLIFEEFAHGPGIRAFETPKLGEIDVPWSPMVNDEPVLSPDYPNYLSNKLQVRFPLVNVVW